MWGRGEEWDERSALEREIWKELYKKNLTFKLRSERWEGACLEPRRKYISLRESNVSEGTEAWELAYTRGQWPVASDSAIRNSIAVYNLQPAAQEINLLSAVTNPRSPPTVYISHLQEVRLSLFSHLGCLIFSDASDCFLMPACSNKGKNLPFLHCEVFSFSACLLSSLF